MLGLLVHVSWMLALALRLLYLLDELLRSTLYLEALLALLGFPLGAHLRERFVAGGLDLFSLPHHRGVVGRGY